MNEINEYKKLKERIISKIDISLIKDNEIFDILAEEERTGKFLNACVTLGMIEAISIVYKK